MPLLGALGALNSIFIEHKRAGVATLWSQPMRGKYQNGSGPMRLLHSAWQELLVVRGGKTDWRYLALGNWEPKFTDWNIPGEYSFTIKARYSPRRGLCVPWKDHLFRVGETDLDGLGPVWQYRLGEEWQDWRRGGWRSSPLRSPQHQPELWWKYLRNYHENILFTSCSRLRSWPPNLTRSNFRWVAASGIQWAAVSTNLSPTKENFRIMNCRILLFYFITII